MLGGVSEAACYETIEDLYLGRGGLVGDLRGRRSMGQNYLSGDRDGTEDWDQDNWLVLCRCLRGHYH